MQLEPSLRELDVGELEGIPVELLGKRLDELLNVQGEDKAEVTFGVELWRRIEEIGGEPLADLQKRAWGAVQHIVDQYADGVIVVVSHYFVILTIICAVLGLPLSQMGRLRLGISSTSTIIFDGSLGRLTSFGDSCHLRT